MSRIVIEESCWLETADGPRMASDLGGRSFFLRGINKLTPTASISEVPSAPLLKIESARGYSVVLPKDAELEVEYGARDKKRKWTSAVDVAVGHSVALWQGEFVGQSHKPKGGFCFGWLVGVIVGDGGFNPPHYHAYTRFWGEEAERRAMIVANLVALLPGGGPFMLPVYNEASQTLQVGSVKIDRMLVGLIAEKRKSLLPELEKKSPAFVAGFLRGFFDTDGSPQGNAAKGFSIRLWQHDRDKLEVVQRMLLRFGIASQIYESRIPAGERLMPDGKGGKKLYWSTEAHELVISKVNISRFESVIGFSVAHKKRRVQAFLNGLRRRLYRDMFLTTITSIHEVEGPRAIEIRSEPGTVLWVNGFKVRVPNDSADRTQSSSYTSRIGAERSQSVIRVRPRNLTTAHTSKGC